MVRCFLRASPDSNSWLRTWASWAQELPHTNGVLWESPNQVFPLSNLVGCCEGTCFNWHRGGDGLPKSIILTWTNPDQRTNSCIWKCVSNLCPRTENCNVIPPVPEWPWFRWPPISGGTFFKILKLLQLSCRVGWTSASWIHRRYCVPVHCQSIHCPYANGKRYSFPDSLLNGTNRHAFSHTLEKRRMLTLPTMYATWRDSISPSATEALSANAHGIEKFRTSWPADKHTVLDTHYMPKGVIISRWFIWKPDLHTMSCEGRDP